MSVETQKETLGFQTEVKQLLHLMIHSLYSNKEIFLRELISNASDAVDKLRFEALSKPDLLEGGAELKIRVSFDKDANTVTLEDNGIGMNRDDVITHLGTIAKSGTADFMKNLTGDQKKDSHLIGQFADVFHGVVGGGIEFEDVVGKPIFGSGAVAFVDLTGKDSCACGFTDSSGTAEQQRLGQLVFFNSVFERICNMRLPHDSIELLGAVFSCRNDEIFHWSKIGKLLR